jgi:tRNA threonylcarbamoyladenosine biosynthesis protein TsaB
VALARGDELLACERRPMRHGHGEALLSMIAACIGPGGFTGIRVGLAAAQGIALAAGASTVGVTSFAAVAATLAEPDNPRPLLVSIDSRRSDLYVQMLSAGEPVTPPVAISLEALPAYVAGLARDAPLRIAGDAAETAAAALGARADLDIVAGSAPDALGVLATARRVWRSGCTPDPLTPLYLRSPDVSFPKPRPAILARSE